MKILLLAPHPFYQERGTPIAVNLMLRVWAGRGDQVTLLTYHEGTDVQYPGLAVHRIPRPPLTDRVGPGFSLKKLVCDLWMVPRAFSLCSKTRPDIVHAVEESVFIARLLRMVYGVPYIYDMDSCLSEQMAEKSLIFKLLAPFLRWFERSATRRALLVVPVCKALAVIARNQGARQVKLLPDISLLTPPEENHNDLFEDVPITGTCFMYIGNLERYQGVGLLLEAFYRALQQHDDMCLIIVGGRDEHIKELSDKVLAAGMQDRVRLVGPLPVHRLTEMTERADVLVSPRLQGINTPMKIYSYLDSGKPVLATALSTHTQVLTDQIAMLTPPEPDTFAKAIVALAQDAEFRRTLGEAGHAFARKHHSFAAFSQRLSAIYDNLVEELDRPSRR